MKFITRLIEYNDDSFAIVRATQEFIDGVYGKHKNVKEIRVPTEQELKTYKDWINTQGR
jgi:hypothetical protein